MWRHYIRGLPLWILVILCNTSHKASTYQWILFYCFWVFSSQASSLPSWKLRDLRVILWGYSLQILMTTYTCTELNGFWYTYTSVSHFILCEVCWPHLSLDKRLGYCYTVLSSRGWQSHLMANRIQVQVFWGQIQLYPTNFVSSSFFLFNVGIITILWGR